MAIFVLMICLSGDTIAEASLEAFLVKAGDGSYYEYNSDELNLSYLCDQLNPDATGTKMYAHFEGLLADGGAVIGLKDSSQGYMDYAAAFDACLQAQLGGSGFDINAYFASSAAIKMIEPASHLKLVARDGTITETEDPVIESVVYDAAGNYGPEQGSKTITGDVIVAADGVILQNLVIQGNLTISEAVGDGNVTLNNVTVKGDTFVRGGGVHSIKITGGEYSRIIMEKTASGAVRIVATGVDGLDVVIAEDATGETIILEGAFASVEVNAPNMVVTTQGNSTTIGKMTVGEAGVGSTVTIAAGTTVSDLVLDGKAAVKGQGTVAKAEVKADGVVFDKKPGAVTVEPEVVIPPVFPTPDSGGGGYTPPAPIAVTGVSLNKTALILSFNDNATLVATVAPADATNKAVSWSSSDATIATVDTAGKVTGSATKEGTATITAISAEGAKSASCTVTVSRFKVAKTAEGIATVTGINGSSTDIAIPETIGGLTITAIGDMAFPGSAIKKVTIPKTVKAIGNSAFINCGDLTQVSFAPGSTLETIGDRAFKSSAILTATIPKTVKTIDSNAFSNCLQLQSVSFESDSSLVTIGNEAFFESGISGVIIPKTVKTIGINAFRNCNALITVAFEPASSLETIGTAAFAGSNVIDMALPEKVTAIPDQAFAGCRGLIYLTLPSGLTAIGAEAFKNCSKLTAITIHKGVIAIGKDAFGFEVDKAPSSSRCYTFRGNVPGTLGATAGVVNPGAVIPVTPSPTIKYYENYTGFNATAWNGYTNKPVILAKTDLTTLLVTNTGTPVVDLEWGSFAEETGYEVYISENSNLSAASIIPTTEAKAKIDTRLVAGKTYYFAVKARDAYGESLLSDVKSVNISYPIPVTGLSIVASPVIINMGMTAHLNATITPADATNQKVIWSSGNTAVATVDPVTGLISTVSPGSVPLIGKTEDGGKEATCTVTVKDLKPAITGVSVPYNGGVPDTAIDPTSQYNGSITWKEQGGAAPGISFGGPKIYVATITLTLLGTYTLDDIPKDFFTVAGATSVVNSEKSLEITAVFPATGSAAINNSGVITAYNGSEANVEIPASIGGVTVKAIGANAFNNKDTVQTVTIPETVTSIGANAFYDCDALNTVTFTGISELKTIGDNAFMYCVRLATITLPPNLTAIGTNAFFYCLGLTAVSIPRNVTTIGEAAFQSCYALSAVSFAADSELTSINKDCFSGCPITTLTLPDKLKSISQGAFYFNRLTGTLIIPATVTSIEEMAFERKTGVEGTPVTTLEIKATPLTIGNKAFKNQELTSIKIPAGVTISADTETMGINGSNFLTVYNKIAGTYKFESSGWSKK